MDLRQLRYFVQVVESGNITHASEILHIAQPAISQQMRNLELDLGFKLLERGHNGVRPTAAGNTLYEHALGLIRQADGTRNLLLQDAEFPQGGVSVAMPSSTARILAIPLARMVSELYPGIRLELTEATSADIEGAIGEGRVDLAIVADHVATHGVASQRLITEELYLLAWSDFPTPSQPVTLAELARMPLILPSSPNVIRNRIEAAMREAGLSLDIRIEASTTALLLAAVIGKLGVTILPWTAAHVEVNEQTIKLARINHRLFARDMSLCWTETRLLSNAVLKVKAALLNLFQQLGKRPEWIGKIHSSSLR